MNVVARMLLPLTRIFKRSATVLIRSSSDAFFLQWLSFTGFLVFAAFLLWRANVWGILVAADPTGITLMIIVVFVLSQPTLVFPTQPHKRPLFTLLLFARS